MSNQLTLCQALLQQKINHYEKTWVFMLIIYPKMLTAYQYFPLQAIRLNENTQSFTIQNCSKKESCKAAKM